MSLLASLVVMLLASLGGAEQFQTVFRNPVFEITMPPGVPLPTPTKVADATGADYSAETPSAIYRMQYTEMPSGDAEKLFASILGNIKGVFRVETQSRFTHQGYPGMRLALSSTELKQVQRMDCIMVDQRLVRVWIIARNMADVDTPAVRAFFESLRIKTDRR